MDGSDFDFLARALFRKMPRRGLFMAVGGLLALASSRRASATPATQLGPATCGASGDVCTMMRGCCSGLTCAHSSINPAYGVCVAGEGERTNVGTTLISPFSDAVVEETATLVTDAQAAATAAESALTTAQSEKDAKQSQRKTRRQTKRTELESRRDTRQLNRETRQTNRETARDQAEADEEAQREEDAERLAEVHEQMRIARGPLLQLELFFSPNDGSNPDLKGPKELVRVTNRDNVTVVLTRIEPFGAPDEGSSEFTDSGPVRLAPGHSFLFRSNAGTVQQDELGEETWRELNPVCTEATTGDGFVVHAAYSVNAVNHRYVIFCDGTTNATGIAPVLPTTTDTTTTTDEDSAPPRRRRRQGARNGGGGGKSRSNPDGNGKRKRKRR